MRKRGYRHAIDEFTDRYCSEPRLSFSKPVVFDTECTWSRVIWRQVQSTFVSVRGAGLRTKPQIAGCLVQIWRRGYDLSNASRSLG